MNIFRRDFSPEGRGGDETAAFPDDDSPDVRGSLVSERRVCEEEMEGRRVLGEPRPVPCVFTDFERRGFDKALA